MTPRRTYSLVHGLHPSLAMRFLVSGDDVDIVLESHFGGRRMEWSCPIHGFPDQPPFHVSTDEPMRGIGIGRARFLWDMLVIHRGWRRLIHTP